MVGIGRNWIRRHILSGASKAESLDECVCATCPDPSPSLQSLNYPILVQALNSTVSGERSFYKCLVLYFHSFGLGFSRPASIWPFSAPQP